MTIKTPLFVLTVPIFAAFTTLAQTPQVNPSETNKKTAVAEMSTSVAGNELIEGKVVSVETGDTIRVENNNQRYLVKLQGIDAPDTGQSFFENSRKGLSKLIHKKDVRVLVQNLDSNAVLVGTVYYDGRDVALRLLEKGMAWYSKRDADTLTAALRKSYSDAQAYASTAGIGLFAEDAAVPPWVFRGENIVATKVVKPENDTQAVPVTVPFVPPNDGRKYILGPRGGCYYVAESGRRVYVKDKRLCSVSATETKP